MVSPKKPVVCVSFDEAAAYCKAQKKRLPTEAEWERAARGKDGRIYPWGDEAVDGERANGCDQKCGGIAGPGWRVEKALDDGAAYLSDVGSYPRGASPHGALDMAGNVWEWVAEPDVIRGGGFNTGDAEWLRSSYRARIPAGTRSYVIGFRCAH